MHWQVYEKKGFQWAVADNALVMGTLPDGSHIVHLEGREPFATLESLRGAMNLAEQRLTEPEQAPDSEPATGSEGDDASAGGDAPRAAPKPTKKPKATKRTRKSK